MTVELRYGPCLVGSVSNVIEHEGTWFGQFRAGPPSVTGKLATRVHDYISFCEEWHHRLSMELHPDAAEYDRFKDLLTSGLWNIRSDDGIVTRIEQAPVFIDGEISWRHASG